MDNDDLVEVESPTSAISDTADEPEQEQEPGEEAEPRQENDSRTSRKRQLHILQSLRWLSAMHIICYHFLAETGNKRWDNFASWGASQLTYFFMLSGFILAYQYTDRGITNVGKFLFKRWARLYPTYLLSIIVQCIALPKVGIPVDAGALVAVLFSLTTWIPRYFLNFINTPGWSVGAFLFQYMLFPTLLKPISRAKQATRFKKLLPACWIFSILEAGHGESLN
jgi:peptidoglycan/LPS O-acetylase OafA/YrhL